MPLLCDMLRVSVCLTACESLSCQHGAALAGVLKLNGRTRPSVYWVLTDFLAGGSNNL